MNKSERLTAKLKSFSIGNFKAFGEPQRIPLKPITLIYGQNSSGKSSILHSILYLKELFENGGDRNVYKTKFGGDCINLGGFKNLINKHNTEKRILYKFEIEISLQDKFSYWFQSRDNLSFLKPFGAYIELELGEYPNDIVKVFLDDIWLMKAKSCKEDIERRESFGPLPPEYHGEMACKFNFQHPYIELMIRKQFPEADNDWIDKYKRDLEFHQEFYQFSKRLLLPEHFYLVSNDVHLGMIIPFSNTEFLKFYYDEHSDGILKYLYFLFLNFSMPKGYWHSLGQKIQGNPSCITRMSNPVENMQYAEEIYNKLYDNLSPETHSHIDEYFLFGNKFKFSVDMEERFHNFIPQTIKSLGNLVSDIAKPVEHWLKYIRYVPPLRKIPHREEFMASKELGNDNKDVFNWNNEIMSDDRGYGPMGSQSIREKTNEWLEEFGLQYEFIIEKKLLLNANLLDISVLERQLNKMKENQNEFLDKIQELHLGKLDPRTDELLNSMFDNNINHLKSLVNNDIEIIDTLRLYDKTRDVFLTPYDVGFGVSQIMAVIMSVHWGFLAIEQPELHLHPALQSKLGDLFIAESKADGNILIETHSEHLLLRIMRRIRETTNGSLPDKKRYLIPPGIDDEWEYLFQVNKDDVAVLYVDRDEDRSIVKEIPLNENGELMKAWPGGFFEEGMEDIFS